MKPSARTSGSHSIICPICEAGELYSDGHDGVQCMACGNSPRRGVPGTLRQITTLADALGSHGYVECGHPERRLLRDGVSHRRRCGSEVLPTRSTCSTQVIGTSRDRRQFGGGYRDAPPALKKCSERRAMQVAKVGEL